MVTRVTAGLVFMSSISAAFYILHILKFVSLSSRVVWHSSLCHRWHFLSLSFWSLILAPVWSLSSVQPKLCSRANQIPYWLMSARITVSYPYNHLRPYNALISSEMSPYDWTSLAFYRPDTIRITELVLLPQPDTVRMTELISLSQPDRIHITNLALLYLPETIRITELIKSRCVDQIQSYNRIGSCIRISLAPLG